MPRDKKEVEEQLKKEADMKKTSSNASEPAGKGKVKLGDSTVLDENIANVISYILGILAILMLFMVKDNKNVRFHAMQSVLLSVVIWLTCMVLIGFLLMPIYFLLWLYLLYSAYVGKDVRLPMIAEYAEKFADQIGKDSGAKA